MKALVLLLVALCPLCHGVQVSPDGRGDVLIFPFLTGETPYNSLISVNNPELSTMAAVRITFRGRSGLDFSLNTYLPPGAAWVGALTGDGLLTDVNRCALGPGMQLLPQRVSDIDVEGYLEIYELGRLDADDTAYSSNMHPCDLANWEGLAWQPPQSSITAQVHLVDNQNGIGFSLAPLVLDQFSATEMHSEPDPAFPSLTNANPLQATFNAATELVTTTWHDPLQMMSAVLAVFQAESDFSIESAIGAGHEVVMAFPLLDATGEVEPRGPALLFSGRARSGFVSGKEQLGRKCTPGFGVPPPYANQRMVRVRLGEQAVFPGDTAPAQNVDTVGNFCGFSTQQPFQELFEAGRLLIQPSVQSFRSIEGAVIRGLPMVAASVTLLANEDFLGVRSNYALVNTVDRRLNIDPAPQTLWPLACRDWDISSDLVALSPDGRFSVIVEQSGRLDAGLTLVDERLNDSFVLNGPIQNSQIISPGGTRVIARVDDRLFELDLLMPQLGFVEATDFPEDFELNQYGSISDDGRFFFTHGFQGAVSRFDRTTHTIEPLPSASRNSGRHLAISDDGQWIVTQSLEPLTLNLIRFDSGEVIDLLADFPVNGRLAPNAFITLLDVDASVNHLVFEVRESIRRRVFQMNRAEQQVTALNPQDLTTPFADSIQLRDSVAQVSQNGSGIIKTPVQLGPGSARTTRERLWQLTGASPAAQRLDLRIADGRVLEVVDEFMVSQDGSTVLAALRGGGNQPDQLCRYSALSLR